MGGFAEKKEPVKLSEETFKFTHRNLKKSTFCSDKEFKPDDFIKAYAYNTSEGNVRDYNEDTITVTKITPNQKDKTDYFYCFAIFDGHGGDGCSIYLKDNYHKNVKEFSRKGIKDAIDEVEKSFLEKKAVNNKGEKIDTSGSCGIIVFMKDKKIIIANIGDSRVVLFKNKKAVFSTRDHKPNVYLEKKRIESAGGYIIQPDLGMPLYQNGKLMERPWRVMPGGLSVSRTLGDIECKDEKFGGKKNLVTAIPDITEFDLNDEYNFIVMGCDGIFDVLSNNDIMDCIKIVLRINKGKNKKMNELCADFASMIIKSAMVKESFDNLSCIVIVLNINGIN